MTPRTTAAASATTGLPTLATVSGAGKAFACQIVAPSGTSRVEHPDEASQPPPDQRTGLSDGRIAPVSHGRPPPMRGRRNAERGQRRCARPAHSQRHAAARSHRHGLRWHRRRHSVGLRRPR